MPPKVPQNPAAGKNASANPERSGPLDNGAAASSTSNATAASAARPGATPRPSPATRGRGTTAKPKFAGRRSATARAELEAQEAKKREAEAKAAAEAAKKKAREDKKFGYGSRGRGGARGGRGRGGHMGDTSRQKHQEPVASGPFSAGQVGADVRSSARWTGSGRSMGGGGGGFGGRGGPGGGGGGGGGGGRSGYSGGISIKSEPGMHRIKGEDGGYVSSDEDEGVPKKNIDQMQVVDLTGEQEPKEENQFVPVRLSRVPHKDRTIGLAAEESPEASDAAEVVSEKRKGKQRAKEVVVTGSGALPRRPTAYSSSDTEGEIPIKQEPTDDEPETRPITPEPVAQPVPEATMTSPSGDVPSSPESKRKAKEKIQADEAAADGDSDLELPPAPRFQTQAELDEWKRYYTDLRQIRRELGRQLPKPVPTSGEEGDVAMAEDSPALEKARQQEEIRRTHVYLFQFPPVLPDLKPITVKPDPEAGEASAMDVDPRPDASELDAATKQSDESHSTQPQLVPGQVGKLRVHKSGKATLDWGGTSMVLGMGAHATFLQNVIIANLPETKPKEGEKPPEEQDSAVAMGMGQIRGKFVLTPNWDEILG